MGMWISSVGTGSGFDPTIIADHILNSSNGQNPETATIRVIGYREMVSQIKQVAGSKKISVLSIFGHGRPGEQIISGRQHDLNDEEYIMVDKNGRNKGKLLNDAEAYLIQLKSYFEPVAIVELHGCETGKGHWGEMLVQRLALILGVTVIASRETQNVYSGFEGRVVVCTRGTACHEVLGNSWLNQFYQNTNITKIPIHPYNPPPPAKPNLPSPKDTFHTVVPGDSLSKIAFKFYGDYQKYKLLYNYSDFLNGEWNKNEIGPNVDLIEPGMRIIIPEDWKLL